MKKIKKQGLTKSALWCIIKTDRKGAGIMEERYLEIKRMGERLEENRLELYKDEEHRKNMDEDFDYIDNKLFFLQDQLKFIARFCLF